jgi:hypothetical protein
MKAVTRSRRGPADGTTELDRAPSDGPAEPRERRAQLTTEHDLTARVVRGLLWCGVACGPAALAWQWLPGPVAVPSALAVAQDSSQARAAAGEAAQTWVVAWLTTPADRAEELTRFRVTGSGDLTLPRVGAAADHVSVADIQLSAAARQGRQGGNRSGRDAQRQDGEQVWSVTVGADVTSAPGTPPTRRFYQVSVQVFGGGARVLGLPAVVPGPVYSAARPAPYVSEVSAAGPLGHTVSGFLAALVAGQGDVSRWTSPQAVIAPVTPPVAVHARIRRITVPVEGSAGLSSAVPRQGQVVHVLVTADLVDAAGQVRTAQWPLQLAGRDGRWEVAGIDPAPLQPATSGASAPGVDTAPPAASGTPDQSGVSPGQPEATGLNTPSPTPTTTP